MLEANISGVQVYHRVPGSPNLPCIVVMPATTEYQVTYGRGADLWEFDLHVLTPTGDDDVGQDLLDEYIAPTGARSIPTVLHANRALGLSGVDSAVMRLTGYGFRFEAAGVPHIGATLRVKVLITN